MIFVTQEDPTQDWSPSKLMSQQLTTNAVISAISPAPLRLPGWETKVVPHSRYTLLRGLRQPLNTSLMALSVRLMVLTESSASERCHGACGVT